MYRKYALLQIKYNIRQFSFWCVLLFMLLLGYLVYVINMQRNGEMRVLLCNKSGGGDAVWIMDTLCQNPPEGYLFEEAEDEEQMRISIARGYANCGFVFEKDFDNVCKELEFDRQITVYQATDAVDGYILREVLFSYVLNVCRDQIVEQYYEEKGIVLDEESMTEAFAKNNICEESLQGLHYEILEISVENKGAFPKQLWLFLMYSVVCIILCGLNIAGNYRNHAGFFAALDRKKRPGMLVLIGMVPVIMLLTMVFVFAKMAG